MTCWAVKKLGNARPYTKSRKKSEERRCKNTKKNARPYILRVYRKESEEKRCKNRKKNLTWAPVIVWKRENPSPLRSSLECSHKMEMKYSEKGTLVQRQRYPLPSRSLQY